MASKRNTESANPNYVIMKNKCPTIISDLLESSNDPNEKLKVEKNFLNYVADIILFSSRRGVKPGIDLVLRKFSL